ncbi:MAG: hypothetical protein PUP91_35460 [Rhizonema sp. PD37]|nr:hypothetical protein [Rhizonema sp. PD37]
MKKSEIVELAHPIFNSSAIFCHVLWQRDNYYTVLRRNWLSLRLFGKLVSFGKGIQARLRFNRETEFRS